jgi:hypothetical protein
MPAAIAEQRQAYYACSDAPSFVSGFPSRLSMLSAVDPINAPGGVPSHNSIPAWTVAVGLSGNAQTDRHRLAFIETRYLAVAPNISNDRVMI